MVPLLLPRFEVCLLGACLENGFTLHRVVWLFRRNPVLDMEVTHVGSLKMYNFRVDQRDVLRVGLRVYCRYHVDKPDVSLTTMYVIPYCIRDN